MTPKKTLDDPRLFQRFDTERTEERFRALYRGHTPMIYALALRLAAGQGTDAEELVQEAWVRALEGLEGFARRSSFRSWLCGILINCHREAQRRRARTGPILDPSKLELAARSSAVAKDRPASAASGIARIDLERAVTSLPNRYREVVVLHDIHGYTHREIANLLAIEEGTSKSQLARARKRLRDSLEPGARPEPASHKKPEDDHE